MDKKTILVVIGTSLFLAIIAALTFLFAIPDGFRGTAYIEPYPPAPNFTLTRSNGETFRLQDQRGKIVMLFFGYASCPDICPATFAKLNQALGKLGDDAQRVQVVLITVDPERDTPERAQEYVDHFNKNFIGLSGSQDELEKVWSAYGIVREIESTISAAGYSVAHTARLTLIDADGNLRLSYGLEATVEDITHDLKILLK